MRAGRQVGVGLLPLLLMATACGPGDAPPPGSARSAAQNSPNTAVVLLLDFSQSFAPYKKEHELALRAVMEGLEQLATKEWVPPIRFFANGIETYSPGAKPPCGGPITYRPRLVVRKPVEGEVNTSADLRKWMRACEIAIQSRSNTQSQLTDISGALAMAVEHLRHGGRRRVIVVFSDFKHHTLTGPTSLALLGEHVIMVWRHERDDPKRPNEVFERVRQWAADLRTAGARSVCALPMNGISRDQVVRCLN